MKSLENTKMAVAAKDYLDEAKVMYAKGEKKKATEFLGDKGEELTERYFDQECIAYEKYPQKILNKIPKSMVNYGAKRPDYILDIGDPYVEKKMVVADSKYYRTDNGEHFVLSDIEIKKYRGLENYLKNEYEIDEVHILFAVWAQELNAQVVFFILLPQLLNDEFITSTTIEEDGCTVEAKQFNLSNAYRVDVAWEKKA